MTISNAKMGVREGEKRIKGRVWHDNKFIVVDDYENFKEKGG